MKALFRKIEPYLTPLLAFGGVFFVAIIVFSLALAWLGSGQHGMVAGHLVSLASALIATAVCVFAFEHGRWDLGVLVSPRRALRGLARGLLVGIGVVAASDLVILAVSDYRHVAGDGVNWSLVVTLLLPAAFGEEVVFRGYVLQKLYRVSPGYAVLLTSLLFAFAHGGNPAVGLLAFTNILLAGILLALLWVWDGSLWAPTWGHLAWNVISGPVLGHELSGLDLGPTLLSEVDPGPGWLTGGDFGIEASVVLTMVLCAAIWLLAARIRSGGHALGMEAPNGTTGAVPMPDAMSGSNPNQNDEAGSQ